jgi:peptide-methionine (R)-S-oxide reductase
MDTPTTSRAKVVETEAAWRQQLTPEQYEQYHVTRQHGTERAFTGNGTALTFTPAPDQ